MPFAIDNLTRHGSEWDEDGEAVVAAAAAAIVMGSWWVSYCVTVLSLITTPGTLFCNIALAGLVFSYYELEVSLYFFVIVWYCVG